MAAGVGYSKVATNGLVFAYDTGDTRNSWKGKPTTNILSGIGYTYGNLNQTYFKSQYGKETSYIPALGGNVINDYCIFFNDYNGGSGNCCPSPFSFGGFSVSPSTVYTYQIIYRTPDGYAHPNYMYHYEYGPGGYVTEYGLLDGSRLQDLGGGWTHAWGTFTSNAATNYFTCYLFHYQYTQTKIQIAGVMLTQGSNIIPPQQFLAPQGSRTTTNSLLDLGTNNTITLNTSYNSNAQIIFDATDDFIDTSFPAQTIANVTMEAVVYDTRNCDCYRAIIQNNVDSDDAMYKYPGNNLGFWPCTPSGLLIPLNQWAHVAVSFDGTNLLYTVNGQFQTVSGTGCLPHISDFDFLRIGAWGAGDGERWGGQIAVSKVYNRALTQSELLQNYYHYKTRFNLP